VGWNVCYPTKPIVGRDDQRQSETGAGNTPPIRPASSSPLFSPSCRLGLRLAGLPLARAKLGRGLAQMAAMAKLGKAKLAAGRLSRRWKDQTWPGLCFFTYCSSSGSLPLVSPIAFVLRPRCSVSVLPFRSFSLTAVCLPFPALARLVCFHNISTRIHQIVDGST